MYLNLVASGDAIPDFMTWSGVREMPWFWEPFQFAWFALPLAVIGPGLLGFVFGLLMFRSRLKGAYFAIVSQALAMILGLFLVAQQGYTGAPAASPTSPHCSANPSRARTPRTSSTSRRSSHSC